MTRSTLRSILLVPAGLALAAVLSLGALLIYAEAFHPWGLADLAWFSAILFSMLAACAAFVALPFLLWRRARGNAMRILVFADLSCVGMLGCAFATVPARRYAIERFVRRATPLVAAIEAFERERGRPPAHLGELVPDFLDRLPPAVFAEGSDPEYEPLPPRWELRMPWGWDLLFYNPTHEYPSGTERIGDWAYWPD